MEAHQYQACGIHQQDRLYFQQAPPVIIKNYYKAKNVVSTLILNVFFLPEREIYLSATYTQTALSIALRTPIQWILHVYHDFNTIWSNLCVWNVGGLAQNMVRGRHHTREVYTQSPRPWIQQACALFKICVCIAITELVSTLHHRYFTCNMQTLALAYPRG